MAFSKNNALELSYSRAPNRYSEAEERKTALIPASALPFYVVTLATVDLAANYVRYFRETERLKPFATVGVGQAHLGGIYRDVNNLGWNVGVGADVPLWNRLAARFEIRDFMSRQPDLTGGIVHNIAPTAGLAYRFN